jgi:5'-deoxynucleotidase YfbR-like HD superfamily hydrolase
MLQQCCNETLKSFVKGSWDKFPEEHKRTFKAILKTPSVPVNTLTFDARVDRNKIIACLAALEAVQLIQHEQRGTAKIYDVTDFGFEFAKDKLNVRLEGE